MASLINLKTFNPEDWHTMHSFSEDAILMVPTSEYFDAYQKPYIRLL